MAAGYRGKVAMSAGAYYAPNPPRHTPETWQSYLSRLGNGLNGVIGSNNTNTYSEEDIVANAEKYMKKKYPGPYKVAQYYNAQKMKWDLRLKFEDPKEELVWLLKYSS